MFKPTTMKDIAKALNLSTSTVSRALRGGYEISEETKKTVLDYAEKINFKRNSQPFWIGLFQLWCFGLLNNTRITNF